MKRLNCLLMLCCFALQAFAQTDTAKKPSTIAFHTFYDDFKTAQLLNSSSFSNTVKNINISSMQTGFGFNYLKGLNAHIDFTSALDGAYINYLWKNGVYNGSSRLLLSANIGLNLKLLPDNYTIVPYLSGGVGLSYYTNKTWLYAPIGGGLQFNVFKQCFIWANVQYHVPVSQLVYGNFQYSIGIGVPLHTKKKKATLQVIAMPPVMKPDTAPVKIIAKNVVIMVVDEQTGQPLPGVEVDMDGPNGRMSTLTGTDGKAIFNTVRAGTYTISGKLNNIGTTTQTLTKDNFNITVNNIIVSLSHYDPRFTLKGYAVDKNSGLPVTGVIVTSTDLTQGDTTTVQNLADGSFGIQLKGNSDFSISGRKAGYISNIEKISTKGLNRSATLYVKLQLGIEQALPDKTIVLSNIYYDTGSAKIRPEASSDLEKLVRFLKDNPAVRIEIASHTDSRGSTAFNLKLSRNRAMEVVRYLQSKGIDKLRLVPKGYGATQPVNGCTVGVKCTDAQYSQNRRTAFRVIK